MMLAWYHGLHFAKAVIEDSAGGEEGGVLVYLPAMQGEYV